MRCHFSMVRMAIICKLETKKYWQGCEENGTLVHCWQECRLVQTLWKTEWNFFKNPKIELFFNLAIPLLGLYPKNLKSPIKKNLCTLMFIAVLFIIAKFWKQPKCPSVNKWIKKLWYIYTMEFYTAERKKELLSFTTAWIDLEIIMLSDMSQSVKGKYHMISLICRIK